jgi:hypothetical protein
MSVALASVCATFKGVPPHIFAEAWGDPEHGFARFQIDLATMGEIVEQINENVAKQSKGKKGSGNLKGRAKGIVARRKQRRAMMED